MKYKIMITTPTIVQVDANSEQEALNKLEQNLIATQQIKPGAPIQMQVIDVEGV